MTCRDCIHYYRCPDRSREYMCSIGMEMEEKNEEERRDNEVYPDGADDNDQ